MRLEERIVTGCAWGVIVMLLAMAAVLVALWT